MVYDNRPGAGGIIAGEVTSHASPDGYTLLFSTSVMLQMGHSPGWSCTTDGCIGQW